MAEARLRVVVVPPAGSGLEAGLRHCVQEGTVVTAYDDSRLRLAARLWDDESVEFVPFGDLLGRFLRMAGVPFERLATRGQRDAIVQLACESLSGGTAFEEAARLPGMARQIADRLDELRHFGIEAENLRWCAGQVSPGLGAKLDVLAEVMELVQDSMDVSHREFVTDRTARLTAAPPVPGPIHHLVVIAGTEERPVYDAWVKWVSSECPVDVLVDLVPGRAGLYVGQQRTLARLGAKPKVLQKEPAWYESLFTDSVGRDAPSVEIVSAQERLDECEHIVRSCRALIGQGASPTDIAVFVRDGESYAPLFVASGEALGVPIDCPRTVPLLSCGLAAVVLQALLALSSSDPRKAALLARNSYCRSTFHQAESLWMRAQEATRAPGEPWPNFAGLVEDVIAELPWLAQILMFREQWSAGTASLSQWLERFRAFVGDADIFDASASAKTSVRERDLRAQTVLQRSIADTAFVYDQAGHAELTLVGFVRLAERIWKDETVSLEGRAGGVAVVSDEASLASYDTLFVTGMLEGSLPKRRREDCVLHDDERQEVSDALGIRLTDSRDRAKSERDVFVRLCASARTRLVFSYPETDDDRDNVPAFYLDEIKRALDDKVTKTALSRWQPAADDGLATPREHELADAMAGPRKLPTEARVTQDWAKSKLAPDWEAGVSPAELGRTLTCPFQASFRFRLGVGSPVRRLGPAVLLDIPRRAGLAVAPNEATATAALSAELGRLLDTTAPYLDDWEQEMLEAAGKRLVAEWVDREFRARALWPRKLQETSSDVQLGDQGLRNTLTVGGKSVKLSGRVSSVTEIEGNSVVQVYDPVEPKTEHMGDEVATSEGAFVHGLLLMCQHGRGRTGAAVEVDGSFGQRVLAVLSRTDHGLHSDHAHGLVVRRIDGLPPDVMRKVRSRLDQAVAVADRADALAVPGDHCQHCLYGEICRKSTVFGESDSPFGQDVAT